MGGVKHGTCCVPSPQCSNGTRNNKKTVNPTPVREQSIDHFHGPSDKYIVEKSRGVTTEDTPYTILSTTQLPNLLEVPTLVRPTEKARLSGSNNTVCTVSKHTIPHQKGNRKLILQNLIGNTFNTSKKIQCPRTHHQYKAIS
jgi:hypothetical protein